MENLRRWKYSCNKLILNKFSRDEVQPKEESKITNNEANTIEETQNERKIRKANKFAVVGIPIFSVAFIVLFFGIGCGYTLTNS